MVFKQEGVYRFIDKIYNFILKNIKIIVFLYTIAVMFFYEGKSSFLYIFITLLFYLSIFVIVLKEKDLFLNIHNIWILLFTIFCIFSTLWALNINNAISIIPVFVMNQILGYVYSVIMLKNKIVLKYILFGIVIGTILLYIRLSLISGTIFIYIDSREGIKNLLNANNVGLYGALATIFGIYLTYDHFEISSILNIRRIKNLLNKYNFVLMVIFILINLIIVFLSASRKALLFIAIPCALMFLFYNASKQNFIKRVLVTIVAIVIFIVLIFNVPFLYNLIGNRLEGMINGILQLGNVDSSTIFRLRAITYGLEWFKERPILGSGLNNFKNLLGTNVQSWAGSEGVYAHNNYIELLVDVGIIGTLLYYSLYIYIFIKYIKKFDKSSLLKIMMFGLLITLIICEFGIVSYYGKIYRILLVLIYYSVDNPLLLKCFKLRRNENG